jgi:ABC-type polysaccharide/polyol phosphate export permease
MKEFTVTMKLWVRQAHRLVSIAFTIVSAAIFIALGLGRQPAQWVYFLPLLPLALLVLSGLYMFFLPYAALWRSGRPARAMAVRP